MDIIQVKNLSKEFKTLKRKHGFKAKFTNFFSRDYCIIKALDCVSLSIKEGEFVGIIGPNGAGKSTLIKILTSVLTPKSGTVKVLSYVPYKQRKEYTKNIGVVFGQRSQLWWDLPATDTFELLKNIYKIPDDVYKENLEKFINVLGIDKYLDTPVRKLSLGERMRCELAASLLHNPKIVFLDEPTIGLDVEAKFRIREFLKEINKKGATIILTTHDMSDIEELCPRIIIIDKGKTVYDGSIKKVKERFRRERILMIDFFEEVDENEFKFEGVKSTRKEGERIILNIDTTKTTVSNVIKKIISKWPIYDLTIEEPQIEEMIRKIYKKGFDVS